MPAQPRTALSTPVAPPGGMAELLARAERCRRAAAGLTHPERCFSLQVFDLARLRRRFGTRWPALRSRATQLIEAGLLRELADEELLVDAGGDLVFAIRAASDRRVVARHGELLAAEVTARLCGTIPAGAIVRVLTQAFDPTVGLIGAGPEEMAAALERQVRGMEDGDAAVIAPSASLVPPRFEPVLHLRKHLVSAYRLTPSSPDAADDDWAIMVAESCLREAADARAPALIVPVRYATLAETRAREDHLRHCRRLPPASRRRLVHEVLGLPAGLPQARVRELLAYLRPLCLALIVRLPDPSSDLDHLAHSGVRGASLAAGMAGEGGPSSLAVFAGRARIAGLRSLLVEILDRPQCLSALRAGLDHLSGEALLPALPRLGRAFMVARGR